MDLAPLRAELEAMFPTPGPFERVWLYRALARVVDDVPWLAPYFGKPELTQQLQALQTEAFEATPPAQRAAEIALLAGDHGVAGAIIGFGSFPQPAGLQALRGLLWVAMRHSWSCGAPFQSHAENIARPIRAAIRSPRSVATMALGEPLSRLGVARTLDAAIAALDMLTLGGHQGLIQAWRSWLRPTLDEIRETLDPPSAPPATGNQRKPKPRPHPGADDDEPENLKPPTVIPLPYRPSDR